MFKKVLSYCLLVILMVSTLIACGKQPESTSSTQEGTNPKESVSAQSTAELPESIKKLIDGYVKPVNGKPKKHLRIAMIGAENGPFWYDVKAGANVANTVLKSLDAQVDWIVPAGAEKLQSTDVIGPGIETAIVKGYDAIAVIGPDDSIVPYIQKARKKGIPVATFNTDARALTADDRFVFVGQNLYEAGRKAGEITAEAIGGKGKVAIITGFFNIQALQDRVSGFTDYMKEKHPDVKIVGVVENKIQDQTSYGQTIDFLTANPDLKAVYVTVNDTGAGKAVMDKKADVKVIAFDYNAQEIEMLKNGGLHTIIGQDPFAQGYKTAIHLFNYLVDGTKPKDVKDYTGYQVITKENASEFEELVKTYELFYKVK